VLASRRFLGRGFSDRQARHRGGVGSSFSVHGAAIRPLASLIDVTESEIRLRGTSSRILRVAGEGPANDGLRPTCVIRDEVHEWNQPKRRENYQVLDAGRAKRGGLGIDISTVGADRDSLLGSIADYGEQIAAGVVDDPGFLYVYHGAEGKLDGVDLSDDNTLREAITIANPSASGERAFVDVDAMVRTFRDLPPGRAKRYILNVWGSGGDEQWLPEGAWGRLADPSRVVEPGTQIYAGFDGSQYRDSTAIVAVTAEGREPPRFQGWWLSEDGGEPEPMIKYPLELPPAKPHLFVPGVFEPVDAEIDRVAVEKAVRDMFATYDVVTAVRPVRLVRGNRKMASRLRRGAGREIPDEPVFEVGRALQPHLADGERRRTHPRRQRSPGAASP
jgi:hypothetical protein